MSPPTPDKSQHSYPVNSTRMVLALMRALWGEVSPALRAAFIKWDERVICVYFFYDGEISEEDRDSAEYVATEVIVSFPEHQLEVEIKRWDYPAPLPKDKGELVYKNLSR